MIITKEIDVKWNPTTKEHYLSKGYTYTKHNDLFKVKIEDLHVGSNQYVDVACDYCKREYSRQYKVYLTSINNSIVGKYSCKECEPVKRIEENKEKQKQGLVSRGQNAYWGYKKNRIKEFKIFLEQNGSIDNMYTKDSELYQAIMKHEKTMRDFIVSAGYNWEEVSNRTSYKHYEDFKNVELKITEFIQTFGYFPTQKEIINDIGISQANLATHGGIDGIKKLMNYSDTSNLIDDRGFYNRSLLEFQTAQYLISNNISYKREAYPFSDTLHRCDFYIESIDGDKYYVEAWGWSRKDKTKRGLAYNKSRKLKEKLYKEYNLISIEHDEMDMLNYTQKQIYLKEKFSVLNGSELKVFEAISFLHPKRLSDEEILQVILEHSEDKSVLPAQNKLISLGLHTYIVEIRMRFGKYIDFAHHFGKTLTTYKYKWTKESIFESLREIVKNGEPINKHTINAYGYSGMVNKFQECFGSKNLTRAKIIFYKENIKNDLTLHHDDILFLERVSENRPLTSMKITEQDIKDAKEIIASFSFVLNK